MKFRDEFHYRFKCTDVYITNSRVMYLPKYFISNLNAVKFESLFNVTNKNQLINICELLDTIFRELALLVNLNQLSVIPPSCMYQ